MFQVSFGTSYWYDISPSCRCTINCVYDTTSTKKKLPVTSLAKVHQIGVDIGFLEKSIFFKILTKKNEKTSTRDFIEFPKTHTKNSLTDIDTNRYSSLTWIWALNILLCVIYITSSIFVQTFRWKYRDLFFTTISDKTHCEIGIKFSHNWTRKKCKMLFQL